MMQRWPETLVKPFSLLLLDESLLLLEFSQLLYLLKGDYTNNVFCNIFEIQGGCAVYNRV